MTTTINIPPAQAIPEQAKPPTLKTVDHPADDIEKKAGSVHSIESAKVKQEAGTLELNKAEKATEQEETPEQTLDNAVKQLNSHVQSINRNLEFNIDNDSGQTVVKVIDVESKELIRQIPNEEALNIAKQLDSGAGSDSKESNLLLIRAQA